MSYGFSLVELIIVTAITALLAAFTIPAYEQNVTKAKISEVVPTLDGLMHQILVAYGAKGSTPASLEGISGTGGGNYGVFTIGSISTELFYNNGSNWTNHGALIIVNLPASIAHGIPGYVQTTNGSDGAHNAIGLGFYDNNGTIILYCGSPDSASTLYIPEDYLPPGCNNENFLTTITG